jgi:hypothetical protein
MSEGFLEFMGHDPYKLQLSPAMGEAVSKWLKHLHPTNTAKMVARDAGLDTRTAENILDEHLSGVTFTKLLRAYGWRFLTAVGAAVIGETYENSINRELEEIAHDRRELEAREASLRNSYARLRARSSLDPGGLRLVSEKDPDARGEDRSFG